jgi:nitrite reductase/ring-hydroxylating ferredoxin subunit
MRRVIVGPVEMIPPGTQRRVAVGGRAIAIFNVAGTLRAVRDVCPHQGAELSAGKVVGSVSASQPGDYEYDATRALVRCPWHGWEFDLATGQSWCDPLRQRVRPYEVSVEHGEELLPDMERQPGPYVADTIPISVENDYIVVELDAHTETTS